MDFDVYPAINPTSVATVEAMKLSGAFFPEAHTDVRKMEALASVGHDVFGFDSVSPYFSILLEASALGAEVDWGNIYEMPSVIKKPINNISDYEIPTVLLVQGEPQDVKRAVEENIKSCIKLISPECAIPFSVSSDNLIALVEAAHNTKL